MTMTHRMTDSREWQSWRHMRERCLNPNHHAWHRYGGRGIAICEAWASFEAFLADMGPRPTGTSLDRIDNDGDYEPANCRWASNTEQNRNRADLRLLTIDGRTLSVTEWAVESGVKRKTIYERLRRGWSADRAVWWAAS